MGKRRRKKCDSCGHRWSTFEIVAQEYETAGGRRYLGIALDASTLDNVRETLLAVDELQFRLANLREALAIRGEPVRSVAQPIGDNHQDVDECDVEEAA